ncbi:MAG TPA: TolC family protein [Planctomycetaceae bacterium]|nr:TolC family protein [Planctomycetaceae bacterium]
MQVGLRPNPTIGYSGQQLGSGGQAEQQGGFLGQQFITGGKLGLNREIAAWEIRRAENEWEATRLRVLTDVRIAFYDVLIAQRRRELTSELVRISDQAVQAAQALFEGEEVSEADPLRARVEADTARILLQNAINAHVAAWRRLAALVGAPDMPLQQVEGKLNPDDMAMSWEEALAKLLAESPELAAAEADVEAARWAVQRAYAAVVPDIDVQAVVQDDRGTGSSNANLQVTFPLPLWNRNQGGIQQAFAQSVAAEMAVNRLRLDLQTRLADAFQRYRTAHNQVREYSKPGGIIANSQRTLELIRSGYQAEEFGILDLLTAQRTFFQTNLAYLDALRELAAATMEIRGLLLSGSLSR